MPLTPMRAERAHTGVRYTTRGQRFRTRRKLTAALLRVVEVVGEMHTRGIEASRENVAVAATMLKVLDRFLTRGPTAGADEPLMVPAVGKRSIELAAARRLKESRKRRGRRGYPNRGRSTLPAPPVAGTAGAASPRLVGGAGGRR